MSSDLIGRRRASEQRLDRARSLELTLKEKVDVLVETIGMPIEQLDFDGSFRAALTALAAVASRRTHFDIIVTLPDAPFAMRIQHVNDAVSAEVLVQRDGPFEPVAPQAYPEPAGAESGYGASAYPAPGYSTPAYSVSSAAYSESAVSYPEPAEYAQPPATYSQPAATYSESAVVYSESTVVAGSVRSISAEKHTVSAAEAVPTGQVASDLAALLWQGLDDMPS